MASVRRAGLFSQVRAGKGPPASGERKADPLRFQPSLTLTSQSPVKPVCKGKARLLPCPGTAAWSPALHVMASKDLYPSRVLVCYGETERPRTRQKLAGHLCTRHTALLCQEPSWSHYPHPTDEDCKTRKGGIDLSKTYS